MLNTLKALEEELEQRNSRKELWQFLHNYGKYILSVGILEIKYNQIFTYRGYNLTYLAKIKQLDLKDHLRMSLRYKIHDLEQQLKGVKQGMLHYFVED